MALRPCIEDGCSVLSSRTRCAPHERKLDGDRETRGYGPAHRRAREAYQRRMDAGERFLCWRCTDLGHPHLVDPTDWHLGHSNTDRSVIRGPQCPASNRDTWRQAVSRS